MDLPNCLWKHLIVNLIPRSSQVQTEMVHEHWLIWFTAECGNCTISCSLPCTELVWIGKAHEGSSIINTRQCLDWFPEKTPIWINTFFFNYNCLNVLRILNTKLLRNPFSAKLFLMLFATYWILLHQNLYNIKIKDCQRICAKRSSRGIGDLDSTLLTLGFTLLLRIGDSASLYKLAFRLSHRP